MTEVRAYRVVRQGMTAPSSRWSEIKCPFCGSVVRAYHWSLAGGGKKCTCGAKHDYYGNTKPKEQKK